MAKKILLAEDSATMRKVVELTFASGGYQVTCVDTVERAIAEAKRALPDVFIADLSMAGKNGYDACRAIKGLASVPVLLLHGERASLDPVRARQVGADGDLKKPFATQAIIDKVEELLRKKPSVQRPAIKPLSTPIETGEVVLEAGVAEEGAERAAPAKGSGIPRPASPAMPPQLGRAARQDGAALKRPRTSPGTAAPVLPQPPAGMPRLGAAPMPPRGGANLPPSDIPVPTGAAEENLDVEIMIEAEPPPEVEAIAIPAPQKGLPTPPSAIPRPPAPPVAQVASGTIDSGSARQVPKPPPRRRVPSQPVAPSTTEKAAPDIVASPPAVQRKVAEAAEQAARAAEQALPAALRGVDPAVVGAIAQLTREVLERVVWEVVPDLAEAIIKEELERLIAAREK